MSNGMIYPKDTLFMRTHVGKASDADDEEFSYEMALVNGMTPIIRSSKTGKWFTLAWGDIVALAVKAGIDKEENDDEKK